MSDDANDSAPADAGAGLASGMIILTTVILGVSLFAIWKLLAAQYALGPLA